MFFTIGYLTLTFPFKAWKPYLFQHDDLYAVHWILLGICKCSDLHIPLKKLYEKYIYNHQEVNVVDLTSYLRMVKLLNQQWIHLCMYKLFPETVYVKWSITILRLFTNPLSHSWPLEWVTLLFDKNDLLSQDSTKLSPLI